MATKLFGQYIETGSIPTAALSGGVVSSSLQIVASLPTGSLSSSAQVNYTELQNIPTAIVSSSTQVTAFLPVGTVSSSTQLPNGIASSSAQVKAYLPTDTVSSSVQVTAFLPADTVSSSGQVTAFLPAGTISSSTQLPSGIASSSAQVTAYLPNGTVSSSGQVNVFSTIGGDSLATTGSNTFTAPQTISDTTNSTSYLDGALHIAGGMSVQKDMRISGSMTINGLLTVVSMSSQYVTSSQYNVGVSKITLNDDDNVRFAGLSIYDSGSSSPASASIFWDSLQHRFLYENLSGSAYNSAILIAGPKNTGSLGSETGLTSGYVPYATGDDHIDNSVIYQSGSNIGIGTTNPSAKLMVNGAGGTFNSTIYGYSTTADMGLSLFSSNNSGTPSLRLMNGLYSHRIWLAGDGSGDLNFAVDWGSTVPRVVFKGTGRVLVNTTSVLNSSGYMLHVLGDGSSGARTAVMAGPDTNTSQGGTGPLLLLYNSDNTTNNYTKLAFGTSNGTEAASIAVQSINHTSGYGDITFVTRGSGDYNERMRINSAGNVGIGTTDPGSYKLQVQGNTKVVGTLETADLQLSNEQFGPNSIDGTTGKWLIQEGQDDLYIINQTNGKKFKFNLIEV